jgi:hypothetical protein
LTRPEFQALIDRYFEEKEWLDFRTAQICSTIVNMLRDTKRSKQSTPLDFMPEKKIRKPFDPLAEDLLSQMMVLNAASGGTLIVNPS